MLPREYEYPAKDAEIFAYAGDIAAFHEASSLRDEAADQRSLTDLRLFMAQQYGNAASTNFVHNENRTKARSKVLLFMLIGFLLAFACEAIIFVMHRSDAAAVDERLDNDGSSADRNRSIEGRAQDALRREAEKADAAEIAAGDERRPVLGVGIESADPGQAVTGKPVPPTANSSKPQRPTPPWPQVMMKDRGIELGYGNRADVPASDRNVPTSDRQTRD